MGTENNYVRLLHQVLNFHCVKLNNPPDGDGNSPLRNSIHLNLSALLN